MIGQALGHYRILEKIGAGGMGEVFRATDTRLGRDVAIKVLPASVSNDPDRVARLEREAQVLASLNHPNIATIYGLEEFAGTRCLVMELVPGKTLAEHLSRGPLSIEEALHICRQVADALEAAHEKGVVHRDLKPANVKVTPEGKVKVLDFGLAKALTGDSSEGDFSKSPTMGVAATRDGIILGTAAYMSPEQARGRPLDRRTDVWAFGCVLFETLTGKQTFGGETVSDTISAILREEPAWGALPVETPVGIRRLLRRCLQKDAGRRLRDIGDVRIEIDDALSGAEQSGVAVPAPAETKPLSGVTLLAALAIGALVLVGAWLLQTPKSAPGSAWGVTVHRLTDFVGLEEFPAISPDGKSLAFVTDASGQRQIWVRLLAGGPPLQLTRDAGEHLFPRWSRDSTSILYYSPAGEPDAPGTLWEIAALGGAPRRVANSLTGADISHDNLLITFFRFASGQMELVIADRNGANLRTVVRLGPGFYYSNPRWSPDGKWIAFQRGGSLNYDIFLVTASGGDARQLTNDGTMVNGFTWLPDSSGIVYSTAKGATVLYLPTYNLWTIRVDGTDLRQLTFGETSYVQPDLGPAGEIAISRLRLQFDLWRFPVDGSPIENVRRATQITRQTGEVQTPSPGPGDRELVYLSDAGGHGNLWVHSMDGKGLRQITSEREPDVAVGLPVWSPDGRWIAYVLKKPGTWNVDMWLVHPDGSNPHKVVDNSGWATFSPDGRWLYYGVRQAGSGKWSLGKVLVEGGTPAMIRTDDAYAPSISTTGTLYYVRALGTVLGAPDMEIRAAKPEDGPSTVLARLAGSRIPPWQLIHPVLSPDNKWLVVPLTDGASTNIWAVPTAGGPLRQLTDFAGKPAFIARRVAWSYDSRSVYAAVGSGDADIILLEGLRF